MSNDDSSGAYGVSPDEPQAKSALVRGFESFLPHHDLPSNNIRGYCRTRMSGEPLSAILSC
jgi:hypothetical protein